MFFYVTKIFSQSRPDPRPDSPPGPPARTLWGAWRCHLCSDGLLFEQIFTVENGAQITVACPKLDAALDATTTRVLFRCCQKRVEFRQKKLLNVPHLKTQTITKSFHILAQAHGHQASISVVCLQSHGKHVHQGAEDVHTTRFFLPCQSLQAVVGARDASRASVDSETTPSKTKQCSQRIFVHRNSGANSSRDGASCCRSATAVKQKTETADASPL